MPKIKPFPKILFFFFAVATIVLIVVLCRTFLMNIIEVKVNGSAFYSSEEILAASELKKWDNSNKINYEKLEEKILKKLVKIEDIEFEKEHIGLETRLVINVKECSSAFSLHYLDKYFSVNEKEIKKINPSENFENKIAENEAKVFAETAEPPLNSIVIEGFQPVYTQLGYFLTSGNELRNIAYNRVTQTILKNPDIPIKSIDMRNIYDIRLNFDNRLECHIGASDDIIYKLNYIQTAAAALGNSSVRGYLIFRHNGQASFVSETDWASYQNKLK